MTKTNDPVEKVTEHLGVMKVDRRLWAVVDLETRMQIGPALLSKVAACAYAFERQRTTYS